MGQRSVWANGPSQTSGRARAERGRVTFKGMLADPRAISATPMNNGLDPNVTSKAACLRAGLPSWNSRPKLRGGCPRGLAPRQPRLLSATLYVCGGGFRPTILR